MSNNNCVSCDKFKDSLQKNNVIETALEIIRDKHKCNGQKSAHPRSLLKSFYCSWRGLTYAFGTQRNLRIQGLVGISVITLAILLKVSLLETAVLLLVATAVVVCELINTALEFTLDLLNGKKFHPLVKITKDVIASSVLLASLAAVIIGILRFSRYL